MGEVLSMLACSRKTITFNLTTEVFKIMANKIILKADSNNNIFDASAVRGTRVSEKGVMVFTDHGKFMHSINEPDPVKANHIRDELTKLVLALNGGRTYEPNWDVPLPSEAVKSDLPVVTVPALEPATSKALK